MQRPSQAEKERRQRWRERENNDAGSELIKPQTGMCTKPLDCFTFSPKQCTYNNFFLEHAFFPTTEKPVRAYR